jgi:hypothetical protein
MQPELRSGLMLRPYAFRWRSPLLIDVNEDFITRALLNYDVPFTLSV